MGGYRLPRKVLHHTSAIDQRDTHMKFTLPKNAFPVLELSKERQNAFIEEADTVVKEIVAANDAFIANGGLLRDSEWRLIRSKEGMQVYRQRRKAIDQRGRKESSAPLIASPSWSSSHALSRYRTDTSESAADRGTSLSSSSGVAEDSIMEKLRPPGVSLMALHGTTDGTLDDCMFGCFAPNDDEWKLRSSYIDDRLDDARIVASIRGPTKEDPYRFLGIKWFAKEHPVVLTGIVQQRDFLILESSGFTRDCNGEKVGYFLMHSVALREIQELSHLGIVRGLMSFCYIFRQCKSGKVDIYTRGFSDFRGEIPGRLALAISADAALCCVNLIQYAYIKKLTWLLKHSGQSRSGNETQPTRCEACEKSFTKCSLISTGPGTACSICRKIVCTKCSVLKKMVMDVSSTGSVQHRSLPFCLGCLLKAKRQCGWEIALSDVKYLQPSGSSPHKVSHKSDGRSQSNVTDYRAYQRGDMTAKFNYTDEAQMQTRATQLPPASAGRVRSWSPYSDERSEESRSLRGIRPRSRN